jgi:hypothetical protein
MQYLIDTEEDNEALEIVI